MLLKGLNTELVVSQVVQHSSRLCVIHTGSRKSGVSSVASRQAEIAVKQKIHRLMLGVV